jgi:hypothetical protein
MQGMQSAPPATQSWPVEQATDGPPPWRPADDPTPPKRGRLLVGLLVGLLAGLLVFAPAGHFAGDRLFGKEPQATPSVGSSPSSTALPVYEARQAELNRAKFDGDLAALAEPWLPYLSQCVKNGDPGAPKRPANEQVRVTCQLDDMVVFFVEFKSTEDSQQDFLTRQRQNLDAQQLAAGVAAPTRKTAPSGKNEGDYIEYAFKPSAPDAPAFVGIWWNRASAPLVAARIEVQWAHGLNQSWEPLRTIWQRRA